jgi:hypothetical protein
MLPPRRNRLAGHAEDARDRHLSLDDRHVAALAAADSSKGAVLPLEVGHLLGQFADHLPLRIESMGEEGVTGSADFRALKVLALCGKEARRGAHEARPAGVDVEWTVGVSLALGRGKVEFESSGEARSITEPLGPDLMTNGTGHTVDGEVVAVAQGEVVENLALPTLGVGLETRHRHVAGRALVLDGGRCGRMDQRLAADGGMPVGVAGRVGHHRTTPADADRDVLPGLGYETIVTGHAVRRGDKEVGHLSADRRGRQNQRGKTKGRDRAFHGSTTPRRACRRTSPTGRRRSPGSFSCPVR